MRLTAIKLNNFRAYLDDSRVRVEPLTALVGRNDVGKSTVFDALGAFLGHELCQPEAADRCVYAAPEAECAITCVFDHLPDTLVIDETAQTTLRDEWLLNADGKLEIKKVFTGDKMKEEVFAVCVHPTTDLAADLLSKRNADLKRIAVGLKVEADQRSNVDLRRAIRAAVPDLRPELTTVPLAKEGAKEVWTALSTHLPVFALFRSDRASRDEDAEVQDPMRIAVREALADVAPQLLAVRQRVERRALEVAERTLKKLSDIDERLASTLSPRIRTEPKWDGLFKLTLSGDNEIPINKRGSGVRRLVLLAFFQAEVERRRADQPTKDVIYAIEEPETSQHPSNQVALVEALKELADLPHTQVMLTTHVPALAGLLPVTGIQFVTTQEGDGLRRAVQEGDGVLKQIADSLGVIPDLQDSRVQVLVCVEGPTDVAFLKNLSSVVRSGDDSLPALGSDRRIAILPLGGDTLRDWVNQQYLRELGRPEVHICDGDKREYEAPCAEVNARSDGLGSWATRTCKREIENYLHPDAIAEALTVEVAIDDKCDVEAIVKDALGGQGKIRGKRLKRILAEDVARLMTRQRLAERGGLAEVEGWLRRIGSYLH